NATTSLHRRRCHDLAHACASLKESSLDLGVRLANRSAPGGGPVAAFRWLGLTKIASGDDVASMDCKTPGRPANMNHLEKVYGQIST
ncbi:MAG: hypothetical protein ABS955_10405, partial [Stenotrophomonas maltophilia]